MTADGRRTGYGWPVLTGKIGGPLPTLRRYQIPVVDETVLLRDGSTGLVLVHYCLRYNAFVERVHGVQLDEWGWASRPVRGQTEIISEHAGGKALDINAVKHPRGVPIAHTFTSDQVATIHRNLARYDGVLGWGGDYHHVVDGMHVEIADGVTLDQVETLARRLMVTRRGKKILAANPGLEEAILS